MTKFSTFWWFIIINESINKTGTREFIYCIFDWRLPKEDNPQSPKEDFLSKETFLNFISMTVVTHVSQFFADALSNLLGNHAQEILFWAF